MDPQYYRNVEQSVGLKRGCKCVIGFSLSAIFLCVLSIIAIEVYDFLRAQDDTTQSFNFWFDNSTAATTTASWINPPPAQIIVQGDSFGPESALLPSTNHTPPIGAPTANTTPDPDVDTISMGDIFGPHSMLGWLIAVIFLCGIVLVVSACCISRGSSQSSECFQKHCFGKGRVTMSRLSMTPSVYQSPRWGGDSPRDSPRTSVYHKGTDSPSSRLSIANSEYNNSSPARSLYNNSSPARSLYQEIIEPTSVTRKNRVHTIMEAFESAGDSDTDRSRGRRLSRAYSITSDSSGPPPYIVALRLPSPGDGDTPRDTPQTKRASVAKKVSYSEEIHMIFQPDRGEAISQDTYRGEATYAEHIEKVEEEEERNSDSGHNSTEITENNQH